MNKKFLIALIVFVLIAIGCGSIFLINNNKKADNSTSNDTNTNIENNEEGENNMNSKTKAVVIYFSATGTTEEVAKKIGSVGGFNVIKLNPVDDYSSADLDWNDNNSRSSKEMNDKSARPEIANTNIDLTNVDTIYLGYPIWWGTFPRIINTFLEKYDVTGKTIIPFCTSGETGISGSVSDLKKYANITVKEGKRFSSNPSESEIREFINE